MTWKVHVWAATLAGARHPRTAWLRSVVNFRPELQGSAITRSAWLISGNSNKGRTRNMQTDPSQLGPCNMRFLPSINNALCGIHSLCAYWLSFGKLSITCVTQTNGHPQGHVWHANFGPRDYGSPGLAVMIPVTSARDRHPHHPLRTLIPKSHAESRTLRLARAWARLESCEQRAPVHAPPRGSKHPYGMTASRYIHHCNVYSVRSESP
jgi:hypothetical protein